MRSGAAYSGAMGALLTPHPGSPAATQPTITTIVPRAITRTAANLYRIIRAPCFRIRNAPFVGLGESSAPERLQPPAHGIRCRTADELARAHRALRRKRRDRIGSEERRITLEVAKSQFGDRSIRRDGITDERAHHFVRVAKWHP